MSTPRQFRYQFQGRRYVSAAIGLGMVAGGVTIEIVVVQALQTSLALLALMVLGGLLGLFLVFFGALVLISGFHRLRLTVEHDAVTIRSFRTTRIALRDLRAVNVEGFHTHPHLVIWPRPDAPIRARFGSYPSRSSRSTGLMLCPIEGWDASAEEVVATVQGVAGRLWCVPTPDELAAAGRTSFTRRLSARMIGAAMPMVLVLVPVGWFSSSTAVFDFSNPADAIFSVFSLIMVGLALIGLVFVVVVLLPQSFSVGPTGLEIHAGGRRDRFNWSEFERLGHSAFGQTQRFLIGWPVPGISRPRFRLAGFPTWHRRTAGIRLVNLYGWDAPAAEMLTAVERSAGGLYDGRHPDSGRLLYPGSPVLPASSRWP